jgi:hypothetical protein
MLELVRTLIGVVPTFPHDPLIRSTVNPGSMFQASPSDP